MAKFIPSQHVESLEYDFTEYGGSEGKIPEPSTGRVNGFFADTKAMMKEVQALSHLTKDLEVEDMTDEQMMERMSKVEEAEAGASEFQKRTIGNLAVLCGGEYDEATDSVIGGSPSVEDFEKLPYRVLQAFSQWLMSEIRPKKAAPAGKR